MFTKFIIIVLCFILIQTRIFVPVLCDTSIHCPIDTVTLLNKTNSVEINSTLTPAIQYSFNDGVNLNPDNEVMCPCLNKTCIPICCPNGQRISREKCVPIVSKGISNWTEIYFPQIYDSETFQPLDDLYFNFNDLLENSQFFNDHIHIFVRDPCGDKYRLRLDPIKNTDHKFKLLDDGSIIVKNGYPISLNDYCLGVSNKRTYSVVLCLESMIDDDEDDDRRMDYDERPSNIQSSLNAGMFISLPFLFLTFVVYSVIPELKNIHGFTLRHYISFLFITYAVLAVVRTCVAHKVHFSNGFCIGVAFVVQFSFLSSFFWLNVMCFDIWWTFRSLRGLQGSTTRQERKKYITYSIYAWSGASFFTAICFIIDFSPNIPSYFSRPQFGGQNCGYVSELAAAIYIYPPMGMIIACNIFFFISTARKIAQHKRAMAHQLNSMDSRRHDDHEQRFNLYLKLFIVMGINWSIEIFLYILEFAPDHIWYIVDLANSLQGVIIFITFVWEDKIKRSLMKRLGINVSITTRSSGTSRNDPCNRNVSASKIVVPIREQNSLHHISNSQPDPVATTIIHKTDCV